MGRSDVETTHEVFNQPRPREDYDAFETDAPLREAVEREAPPWVQAKVAVYGPVVGSRETLELAQLANKYPPELRSHDRYGHRIDEVDFHPAYHALMEQAALHGVHSLTWTEGRRGGHVAHAALIYLHAQAEAGTSCPLTMTHASVPSLRAQPEIAAFWEPKVATFGYDRRMIPVQAKTSVTLGMAMTEKQGGSDVRANTTRARPLSKAGPGQAYELTGHKWFCSAPMSDAFLTLAQTEQGLSCFLVPRFLPDGSRNRFLLQRLKNKLGNRSNASSEVEYDRTFAQLLGEEGRGVKTILEMVGQTRVDCAAGSAGLMRQGIAEAIHHARERSAFGKPLVAQPLMQSVLADLCLEVEAATTLALRVARSHDDAAHDAQARAFSRVATPIAKYWITHRAPQVLFECMECLGGAGYVEESILPRLYREAPVNSIWEGSGNVQCIDVLRALSREPAALEALSIEIRSGITSEHDALARSVRAIEDSLRSPEKQAQLERKARHVVEQLALALSASLLARSAPSYVADAYAATRLLGQKGSEYGSLDVELDAPRILERALPL